VAPCLPRRRANQPRSGYLSDPPSRCAPWPLAGRHYRHRAILASQIAETEQRIKELHQGSALDRAIARLDHFTQLDNQLQTTGLH